MDIDIKLYGPGLGDHNTDEDNQRYIAELKAALKAEYPESYITVGLQDSVAADSIEIDFEGLGFRDIAGDDEDDDAAFERYRYNEEMEKTRENVKFILQRVFEKGDWHFQ